MQRVENRLQEVAEAGNVQPHRLQFLRMELEDIRTEMANLDNLVRREEQQHQQQPNAPGIFNILFCSICLAFIVHHIFVKNTAKWY